jgi:DNA polymerase-1
MRRILVNSTNLSEVADLIATSRYRSFDTETFGLDYGKKMFSMMICTGEHSFYFNFHDYGNGTTVLDKVKVLKALDNIISIECLWFMHNAKYDIHRLHYEDVQLDNDVHCTQVFARLEYNQHMLYSLEACCRRLKIPAKSDAVKAYIKKHKLFTWETVPGKSKRIKHMHYEKVPFDIMFEYGCIDAEITWLLGMHQIKNVVPELPPELVQREYDLTKVCAKMEQRGVLTDIDYVTKGWEYEENRKRKIAQELKEQAGRQFKNGPKWLKETFDDFGIQYEVKPETGNPIFDKAAMGKIQHPIAKSVVKWRRADKYIGTYYSSFARHHRINAGVIHANIKMHGTDTFRFSYSDPNLQNVPKADEGDYDIYVRKCLVPRENHVLCAIDYRQQEVRLMLDYAGEKRLIKQVNEGADVHQATAELVGVTRKQAKGVNFGLLYGMGVRKLAVVLGVSEKEAAEIRFAYFYKLPKVENFIYNVIQKARLKKKIKTWAGRYLHFPNKDFAYKAPNHLIQGGCADMVRTAMVRVAPVFDGMESYPIIQVHDELLFELHRDEMDVVPKLTGHMKNIYKPINGMLMDCSVELSDTSWGKCDMKEVG